MAEPARKIYEQARDLRKSRRQARADNYPQESDQAQQSELLDPKIQELLREEGGVPADNYRPMRVQGGRREYMKNLENSSFESVGSRLSSRSGDSIQGGKKKEDSPRAISRSLNRKRNFQKKAKEELKKKVADKTKSKIKKKIKKQIVRRALIFLVEGIAAIVAVIWPWVLGALVIVAAIFFIYYQGCTNGFAVRWVFERMTGVTCVVDDANSHDASNVQAPVTQGSALQKTQNTTAE